MKGKNGEDAAELLNWAKEHTKSFLITAKALLPAEWQLDMDSRTKPNKFIKKVFKGQSNLLSPWWTTTTFFDTFTGQVHQDPLDHQPSFLFNFGAPCLLVLHDYGINIWLDPLNIVVFNTNTLKHSTEAAGEDQGRWAFSAFYRKSIYEEMGPSQIGQKTLDRILGPEDVKTRVPGANK
ncbi:conserved hypothetical protein [Sporisorium reilianum SRZ2]|uniref:Uncharacterized protein n=1 Tax=Sporisorium reilianum (strain SRZ2) TaxID=999809 RepID=E7A0A4_SPORE|nr:conserved hypothetical protein [Sporisorium reilianum SRZ2]